MPEHRLHGSSPARLTARRGARASNGAARLQHRA
jgi:hypothetical protein